MRPKVSIIVPVYNVERYLPRCLESLTAQPLRDIEIVGVDDESPDGSLAILRDFAARDARIRVVSQRNKRQGGARNTGMDLAAGEWIAFVDSDDWVDPDYFERLLAAAERHDADIACACVVKERGRIRKWNVHYTREALFDTVQAKFEACHCPPNFNTTNKLYRHARLTAAGIRFREHAVYEDVEFQARTLATLGRMVTVPCTAYHYRVHGASTTKSAQSPRKQRDKYEAHKAFVAFADAHGIAIGRRFRDVTKRDCVWCGISWLKIKDDGRRLSYRLLDLLPVWRKKIG